MDIFFQQLECWKALKPQLSDVVMIYRGLYFLEAYVTSIIIILELWRAFGPTLKISLGKCVTLNFVFIFFVHQCWLYKKPTEKMLVTFILGNKNCKRAWRFPIKTLPTTVCIDFSYNKAQLFIPLQVFCSFEIHLQIHTIFFFYFFRISRCWDRVQGSPWRINYRSTLQNYNGRHKVSLPPTVS